MTIQSKPIEQLLPLLRLLDAGVLKKNRGNTESIKLVVDLQWAALTGRSNTVALTERGKEFLPQYISNLWPGWEGYLCALKANDLPISIDGAKELERSKRALSFPLPARAHHKTIAATLGMHSKTGLSQKLKESLGDVLPTTDQVLRLHSNKGLILQAGEDQVSCDLLMKIVGEVVLPERAFLDGLTLAGVLPKTVLTIENLGNFVDIPPVPDDVMVIWVPGKNTTMAVRLLSLLDKSVRHYHFGDLDYEGVSIARYLCENTLQPTELLAPSFWEEAIDVFTGFQAWPNNDSFGEDIPLLKKLRERGRWLEQEVIALDPRLRDFMLECLSPI